MHNYKDNDRITHNGRKYDYEATGDVLGSVYPEAPKVYEPPDNIVLMTHLK